jgi:endonuclease III
VTRASLREYAVRQRERYAQTTSRPQKRAGLDHKELQKVLADLIPPNLRYSLHVNLVAHGRATCKSVRPACGECEVRRFCTTFEDRG